MYDTFGCTQPWDDHDHAQQQAESQITELADKEILNTDRRPTNEGNTYLKLRCISTHKTDTGLNQETNPRHHLWKPIQSKSQCQITHNLVKEKILQHTFHHR
jgi:hypothetical protein